MSLKSGKMSIQKTSRLCWLQVVGWGSLSGIRSPWSSDWWLWSGVHHCQETWWMDVTRLDSWMTELMAWNAMTSRRIRRLNTEWCQGFDWRLAIHWVGLQIVVHVFVFVFPLSLCVCCCCCCCCCGCGCGCGCRCCKWQEDRRGWHRRSMEPVGGRLQDGEGPKLLGRDSFVRGYFSSC